MNGTRHLSRGKIEVSSAPKERPGEKSDSFVNKVLGSLVGSGERPARVRKIITWTIFWTVVILLMWNRNPTGWINHTQAIFVSFFVRRSLFEFLVTIFQFLWFTITVLISPTVLKPLIVLLAPFLLAWQMVAIYLQDIFELDHTKVARNYILRSALASEYERINIRAGTIDPKKLESPLIQIGGPGRVQVELDSATLFEKADGSSRVIGPTVGGRYFIFIEGFERLRDVIDLHDLSTDPMTNLSRSRDGIPVYAKDVRMVYSVQRGSQKTSLEKPYPFTEEAIRQLVYRQLSFVAHGQPKIVSRDDYWKQTYKRWSGAMPILINSALGDFVSEHDLSEFLANVGTIELDALQRLEAEIQHSGETMATSTSEEVQSERSMKTPEFTSRSKITNLFYDFTYGFSKKAENRGVQLEWIGVGTWGTPASSELVNKNHLEAWRISRENYLRGHHKTLEHLREDARLQGLQSLLNKALLETYRNARRENLPANQIAHKLLTVYREQFLVAYDLYDRDRKSDAGAPDIPFKLTEALRILNGFLGHRIN